MSGAFTSMAKWRGEAYTFGIVSTERMFRQMTTRSHSKKGTKTASMVDCGKFPSDPQCTLKFIGSKDEVLDAAVQHAIAKHGYTDSSELRASIEQSIETVEV